MNNINKIYAIKKTLKHKFYLDMNGLNTGFGGDG
jgi:predicted GNAT superfamily acetyltransferase